MVRVYLNYSILILILKVKMGNQMGLVSIKTYLTSLEKN